MPEPPPPGAKPAAKAAPAKPAPGKPAPGKAAAAPVVPPPPAAPTNKAEIRARLRKGRPVRFEVPALGAVLGRDEAAAVPIHLDGVSREHARIAWDGRGWWIEDLKSTNGTFLNGERIVRDRLQHLDVIGLGRKAELVFVLRSLTEAPAETRKAVLRAALVDADGTTHEVPVGEFTVGRSVACNLRADVNSVSKVHARVERSSDQVLVTDLSSSNGTFVNGARVRTAVLRDGDMLDLAGVVKFQVIVEQGETTASGVFRAPAATPKEGQPQFSGEWKTRYEWDPAELAAIAAAAAGVRPAELDREAAAPSGPRNVVQAGAKKAVAVTPPPPAAAKPAVAAKPAAPAKPATPPPKPVVVPAPPAGEAALDVPVPRPVKTPAPAPPAAAPTPAPGRPPTPVGTDPATTPDQPGLNPAPADVRSAIVPADAPESPKAVAPAKPAAPPPKPAAPPAAPASPAKAAAPPVPPAKAAAPPAPVAPVVAAPAPPVAPARPASITAARLAGEKFAFEINAPGRYEVGRAASAALRVEHTTVSRRHAALSLSEDRQHFRVEDLGAANGTRVNGTQVKGTQDLKDGDVLELGEVRLAITFDRG